MGCCGFGPISESNHLEIYLRPNEKPPPPPSPILKVIVVTLIVLIVIYLCELELHAATQLWKCCYYPTPDDIVDDMSSESSSNSQRDQGGGTSSFRPDPTPVSNPSNHRRVLISQCYGVTPAGADFRDSPSQARGRIKGFVPAGDWVILTGLKEYDSEGTLWYEVMNESGLIHSATYYSSYQTQANQVGWIHSCFVDS